MIDEEVHSLIEHASQTATKILTENKERLVKIAKELIVKETLEAEELEAVLSESAAPSRKAAAKAASAPAKPKAKTKTVPKEAEILPEPPAETSPGYA